MKMSNYTVVCNTHYHYTIEVEAETPEDAEAIVQNRIERGELNNTRANALSMVSDVVLVLSSES